MEKSCQHGNIIKMAITQVYFLIRQKLSKNHWNYEISSNFSTHILLQQHTCVHPGTAEVNFHE